MFDCCRVPNEGLDYSISYATPGDLGNSGHIIVLRRNRVWKVEIIQNGRLLSTRDIEKQVFYVHLVVVSYSLTNLLRQANSTHLR